MTRYDDAVAAIDGAISTVTVWCDQVRQDAEQRMGVPAGAESVIGDPRYLEALEIRHDLTVLRGRLTDPRNGF
ncbi:hypothetical protein AB0I90_31760 [Micromonospora wenchangensis]|uniref:hypothetical protein n=1 Tax=Micromonospora wenchangensis TaxID=1185415 RepID=UPI0033D852F2